MTDRKPTEPREQVEEMFLRFSDAIPSENKKELTHFLEHDEFEMAFEGLLIELLNAPALATREDLDRLLKLAVELNLSPEDNGGVWDYHIVDKLKAHIASRFPNT